MPGPFPGMDPYLEDPVLWQGVHLGLIGVARATLNQLLPPGYVADIGERLYVLEPGRSIYPDVAVFEQPVAQASVQQRAGTAVAAPSDPPWVLIVEPIEVREVFVKILPVGQERRIVTVIEVLSPSNKAAGSEGRQLYLAKQREVLNSPTHLIEIDLLRSGEHTAAPPRAHLLERGPWDYLASLHRGGQRGRYEIWSATVRERLPRILVPLAGGDPDIVLDLQTLFDRCYEEGAYARRIDYRRDPAVALRGEDAEWAAALLREHGLRP